MSKLEYRFSFTEYDSIDELDPEDAWLLGEARDITKSAYAPYSQFLVGAVAKLANGEIIAGTNQENASYPVGLCAERALLASAATVYPNVPINTIAISYQTIGSNGNHPISPCGMCRQALQEFEERTNQSIRLILGGLEGKIFIIDQASQLLPLAFTGKELKK